MAVASMINFRVHTFFSEDAGPRDVIALRKPPLARPLPVSRKLTNARETVRAPLRVEVQVAGTMASTIAACRSGERSAPCILGGGIVGLSRLALFRPKICIGSACNNRT
jgi:hypothetical protein